MLSELKNNKYVYHYTSFDTLFAILHNYREKGKNKYLVFRASNIFEVNDPTEMEAGYNALKKYLPQYEESIGIKNKLSEIYENEEYEDKCKKEIYRREEAIDTGTIPYIVSFSAKKDYLPMWSLYGKKGKGVCLKFNVYEIIDNTLLPCQMGFVSYGKNFSKDLKENLFPRIYHYSIKENMSYNDKISELATLALSVAPFHKYSDYKYEKEFRFVHHYELENDPIQSFPIIRTNKVKPYVEIPVISEALKDVIIGPSADYDVMQPIIDRELSNCGLKIKSHKSRIPFRLKN